MKHALALLLPLVAGCIDATPLAQSAGGPAPPVYFATWSTVDERGVAGDCKEVADVVRISARDAITGEGSVFTFDCRANRGDLGSAIRSGATVGIELLDCNGSFCVDNGVPVATLSADPVPAVASGTAVDLGPFAFDAL